MAFLADEEVPKRRPMRKRSVNVTTLDDETANKLKADFARFDTNHDGKLSTDEVFVLLKESYLPTEAEIDNVLRCLDVEQDGVVKFSEFLFSFYRVYRVVTATGGNCDFETAFNEFATELQSNAKSNKQLKIANDGLVYSEEVVATARAELGEEWVNLLAGQFAAFSSTGSSEQLHRNDLRLLLKAAFTPGEEKINKIMLFMGGATASDITLDNFINGMTLLYGDLSQLTASPIARMSSPWVSPFSSPDASPMLQGQAREEGTRSPLNLGALSGALQLRPAEGPSNLHIDESGVRLSIDSQ